MSDMAGTTPDAASFGKVVVTGGAGLIGSHVVDLLVAGQREGRFGEVVVFDNLTRGRLDNLDDARATGDVRIVEGDIRDVPAVDAVIEGAELVFHLAAIRITHCAEDPRLALEVLGDGTFNVVDAAHRAGATKLVMSSSASVYGLAEEFPTTERHHTYNNRTLYGALKAFDEGLLRSYHDMFGLQYVALRYFNVYGPRMDVFGKYTEVLIRWMERLIAGEAPIIFGDGSQTMDFVHVADIARANLLAATSAVSDEVFNVASGTETSLDELATALAKVMGSDLRPVYGPERAVNPVPRRLADTTRAREVLGFEAGVDLETGLRGLVEWWRSVRDARPEATS
jgi:UDP-glucose 4-epimerase